MDRQHLIDTVHKTISAVGDPAKTRVVVAMSGGVDSSVAAALVNMAGYETVGITLQLYDHGEAIARKGACCAGQDIHDARNVAADIGIPHYVLDYESRFSENVIDNFVESYLAGETPVPCITCNQTVKFADLLAQSRALGASCLVTGHYVASRKRDSGGDHFDMFTPADMARDQSYFLAHTTQAQLDFLRFPLAGFDKSEIRDIASELNLKIAEKPDSQDICFVPSGNYGDVIRKRRPDAAKSGDIVHLDGRVLGQHDGIIGYTIGQRRGIGVADNAPLYVSGLDAGSATVYVGPKAALARDRVFLKELNWITGTPPSKLPPGMPVYVKLRSTRPAQPARLYTSGDNPEVRLDEPDFGVSPGQACVIYDSPGAGAQVLGGAFISRTGLSTESEMGEKHSEQQAAGNG